MKTSLVSIQSNWKKSKQLAFAVSMVQVIQICHQYSINPQMHMDAWRTRNHLWGYMQESASDQHSSQRNDSASNVRQRLWVPSWEPWTSLEFLFVGDYDDGDGDYGYGDVDDAYKSTSLPINLHTHQPTCAPHPSPLPPSLYLSICLSLFLSRSLSLSLSLSLSHPGRASEHTGSRWSEYEYLSPSPPPKDTKQVKVKVKVKVKVWLWLWLWPQKWNVIKPF